MTSEKPDLFLKKEEYTPKHSLTMNNSTFVPGDLVEFRNIVISKPLIKKYGEGIFEVKSIRPVKERDWNLTLGKHLLTLVNVVQEDTRLPIYFSSYYFKKVVLIKKDTTK